MTVSKWAQYLPEWAGYDEKEDRVEVDPNVVYPMFLRKIEHLDPKLEGITQRPTKNALEIARHIFTRTLKSILYTRKKLGDLKNEDFAEGKVFLKLRILPGDKRWALKNYPDGEPIDKVNLYYKLGIAEVLN